MFLYVIWFVAMGRVTCTAASRHGGVNILLVQQDFNGRMARQTRVIICPCHRARHSAGEAEEK